MGQSHELTFLLQSTNPPTVILRGAFRCSRWVHIAINRVESTYWAGMTQPSRIICAEPLGVVAESTCPRLGVACDLDRRKRSQTGRAQLMVTESRDHGSRDCTRNDRPYYLDCALVSPAGDRIYTLIAETTPTECRDHGLRDCARNDRQSGLK